MIEPLPIGATLESEGFSLDAISHALKTLSSQTSINNLLPYCRAIAKTWDREHGKWSSCGLCENGFEVVGEWGPGLVVRYHDCHPKARV